MSRRNYYTLEYWVVIDHGRCETVKNPLPLVCRQSRETSLKQFGWYEKRLHDGVWMFAENASVQLVWRHYRDGMLDEVCCVTYNRDGLVR